MSNHMNFKLILSSEALFANCAGKPLLRMKCFNVLPYARILFKSFFTMRTSKNTISLCSWTWSLRLWTCSGSCEHVSHLWIGPDCFFEFSLNGKMGDPCSPACSTSSNHVSYCIIHICHKKKGSSDVFRDHPDVLLLSLKLFLELQANSLGMEGRSSSFSFFTFCFDFMNLLSFIFRSLLSGCTFYLLRNHQDLSIWK